MLVSGLAWAVAVIPAMLLRAAAGVIIGYFIMGRIDSQTTQRLIGVILVSLVGLQFWRSRSKAVAHLAEDAKPHRLVSAVAGVSVCQSR